jgi:hypothetical protein
MKPFSHEGLPDVTAYALTANLQAGKAQELLVQVSPGGQVPLRNIRHGFKASPLGLLFVSRNGGIIDEGSRAWDIQFQQ